VKTPVSELVRRSISGDAIKKRPVITGQDCPILAELSSAKSGKAAVFAHSSEADPGNLLPNVLPKSRSGCRLPDCALAIFTRSPRAGFSKTRLIPLLGAQGAAEMQRASLADAVEKIKALHGLAALYLIKTGRSSERADRLALGSPHVHVLPQRGKDLGERLNRAFGFLLQRHRRAIVTGTDSPELPAQTLLQALQELCWCEAVLGPCPDGGYYLIGLRRGAGGARRGRLLGDVRWGTRWALRDTLRNLISAGVSCSLLQPLADVDRPADFIALRRRMKGNAATRRIAPATWRFVGAFDIAAARKSR